ncbi:MAG: LysR family transcriptional regulator [Eubacterium sp.]|nr:LysR family transcriptional regulator [Eubacterium sp.]
MTQNLSSYRIFYTVAKYENISKAAKELYISQPAISKSIRKLEESLEVKLFNRSSKGVTLTDEGAILFNHVEEAFTILDHGEDELRRNLELGVGHIKLGVSTTLCKFMLLPYLNRFIKNNPHIKISISCQSSSETLDLISSGQIDMGFVSMIRQIKDITFNPVGEITDTFVASRSYLENLSLRNIKPENYLSEGTLMLLNKQNMTRKYVETNLLDCIDTSDSIEVSSLDLLIEFAKIGLGISCVIKDFVLDEIKAGTLIEVPAPIKIPSRPVGFAYRRGASLTPAVKEFISNSSEA